MIQIAYNRRFVAKFHDSKVEILSFTKNEIKTVVLQVVEKIDQEVYLQHFIEENEYFNSVKSSVSPKPRRSFKLISQSIRQV